MGNEELRIDFEEIGGATVVRMVGRFDGAGAARFDREAHDRLELLRAVVLDLAEVSYVSSAALRSFLRLERSISGSGGNLVLAGPTPYVTKVLEISGLLGRFRTAANAADALALLGTASPARPDELRSGRRRWRVVPLSPAASRFVLWGRPAKDRGTEPGTAAWESPSVAQLGLAVGVGGLGTNRGEAARAAGPFVSTGRLVAMAPAGDRGEPVFRLTDRPQESTVHVARATALDGSAAFHIFLDEGEATVGDLADDVLELARRSGRESAGFAAMAATEGGSGQGLLVAVGIAGIEEALLPSWGAGVRSPSGAHVFAVGVERSETWPGLPAGTELSRVLAEALSLESLGAVSLLPATRPLARAEAWVFVPGETVSGSSRLTEVIFEGGREVPDEWRTIVSRIYSDAGRVTLGEMSGGYSATTFQAQSLDREGRRTIPTVLKIADLAFTTREERAWRESVQPFILNNATVIMGHAVEGPWAGLRYNFLGITGPSTQLRWLGDRYAERPFDELAPILDNLFSRILDPWYGQAREEEAPLRAAHDPSGLFPNLPLDGRDALGVDLTASEVEVPELDTRLRNPYRYLTEELPRRRGQTRRCKVSITHGDLNLNNVLLDEKDNIYVIDFSETRRRSVVSDFARLEALLALQTARVESIEDLVRVARFVEGLVSVRSLEEPPPLVDDGKDAAVKKAWEFISLLRRHAARVAAPSVDLVPYLLSLLEWTLPVVSFRQVSPLGKRLSMIASALILERLAALDPP